MQNRLPDVYDHRPDREPWWWICGCGTDSDLCFSDPDRDFPDHLSVAEPQCSFHAGIEYNN